MNYLCAKTQSGKIKTGRNSEKLSVSVLREARKTGLALSGGEFHELAEYRAFFLEFSLLGSENRQKYPKKDPN